MMNRFLINLRQLGERDDSVALGVQSREQTSQHSALNFRTVLEERVLGNLGETLQLDTRTEWDDGEAFDQAPDPPTAPSLEAT